MTAIQDTISHYITGKRLDDLPSSYALPCFVGMIETGEATYDDFRAVGGRELADEVARAKHNMDAAREVTLIPHCKHQHTPVCDDCNYCEECCDCQPA